MKKLCDLIRKYVTVGNVCRLVNVLIDCFAYACTFMLIYVYLYKDEYTWRNKYLFANKEDDVTHPDADHIGGADFLIREYNVKTVYMTSKTSTTMEYKEVLNAIDNILSINDGLH